MSTLSIQIVVIDASSFFFDIQLLSILQKKCSVLNNCNKMFSFPTTIDLTEERNCFRSLYVNFLSETPISVSKFYQMHCYID